MAQIVITHETPGVLCLNSSFSESALPGRTISSESFINTRYFLIPQSVVDISQLNNVTKVSATFIFSFTRSKGVLQTRNEIINGNKSSITRLSETLWYYTAETSKSNETLTTDTTSNNLLPMYKDNSILFDFNSKKYYAFRTIMDFGGTNKYSGSYQIEGYRMTITYEDSTKIYNGSNGISSAYLGSTKLNGIYLGSQKLL